MAYAAFPLLIDTVIHRGLDDGTGVVIGKAGYTSSTGSAPQIVSMTAAERGYLTAANGMLVYNSTAGQLQAYVNGAWTDLGADQLVIRTLATTGLTLGAPVYVSASGVASHTNAGAVATSEVVGFVKLVGAVGVGEVVVAGKVDMACEAGLSITANQVMYLSTTTGRVTDVPPPDTGDTVYEIGYASETVTGPTSDGDLIECVIHFGGRVLL